ncbi:MAG: FtsQ-type POTRA domain-containing protein [Candidatus Delongbacteria bacterium]|nr:FtsQ-type POTRA domain-containing protein [Candidatus Delongbacteria bacterium]
MNFIRRSMQRTLKVFKLITTACIIYAGIYSAYYFYKAYRATSVFDLKKITVRNNRLLTPGDVIELTGIKRGTRTDELDLSSSESKLNSSPYVKRSRIRRIYPASIEITVVENEPLAYLNSSGTLKYVNADGKVLGKARPGEGYDLPVILNGPDSGIMTFLNECTASSPFTYHHISEIQRTDRGIELYLIKSSAPVIIGTDEFKKKIIVLEYFLKNEYNNLAFGRIEYIDLRFDKQVVLKEFTIAEN